MEVKVAAAGSLLSCDAKVTVETSEDIKGISIDFISPLKLAYGKHVEKLVKQKAEELGIKHARIKINDRGALDYVIKARVETAINRLKSR